MTGRRTAGVSLALCVAVALVFVGSNHDRVGVTWDEGVDSAYGEKVLDYFASGFTDRSCNDIVNMRYYGPLAEAAAAISYRGSPERKWPRRHFVIGLFAIGALILTGWIARQTGSWQTAALAPIALITMPRFVGHALTNSKDIPFAAGITGVAAATLAIFAVRRFSGVRFTVLGVAIGVSLGIRPGGIVVVGMMILAAAACSDLVFRSGPAPPERVGLRVLASMVMGYVIMVLVWPFAHLNPLLNPIIGFANAVSFQASYEVLFEGSATSSDELPARYLLKMFAISTPVAHLVLAGVGTTKAVGTVWRAVATGANPSTRAVTFGLLLIWISAPLAGQAVLGANVYDGVRHFLFLLPAIAILTACGAAALSSIIRRLGFPRVGLGISIALLLLPLPAMLRVHPYHYAYYNAAVGGLGGAAGYETDYWAMSYREAMEWIHQQIDLRTGEPDDRVYQVLVGGTSFVKPAAEAYARSNVSIEVVSDEQMRDWPEDVDWYIGVARYNFATDTFADAPVVHRISREGATLSVIRSAKSGP